MIRIINITPVVKKQVKEMVLTLKPEVGYVRISTSGVVTLKKNWFSFKKVNTTVTDLLIGVLPVKIAEFTANNRDGINYQKVFNQDISNIISLRYYNPMFDVCEYIWSQYNTHCVSISDILINTNSELIFLEKNNYLPSVSPISSVKVTDLIRNVQGTQKDRIAKRFIKKINRMKNTLVPINTFTNLNILFGQRTIITTTEM